MPTKPRVTTKKSPKIIRIVKPVHDMEQVESAATSFVSSETFAPPPSIIPERTPSLSWNAPQERREGRTRSSSRFSLGCILFAVAILVFPFVSWPWTFSLQDFPKLVALSCIVGIGLIVVLATSWRKGSFDLIPKHLAVVTGVATLVVMVIGAFGSGMTTQGLFGNSGTETTSVLAALLLGLWVLLAFHGGRKSFSLGYGALCASGSILSLVTLLSLFGISAYRFVNATGFNPAGTTTTAAIIASISLILSVGGFFAAPAKRARILYGLACLPPGVLLIGSGFVVPLILAAIGFGVLALVSARMRKSISSTGLAGILIAGIVSVVLAIWPVLNFIKTPLEVGPSHKETVAIARAVLADHPLMGSGPATFGADYLRYRSSAIVQTPFWNISFDWGASAALTWFATLGWLGGGLFLLTLFSVLLSYAWRVLVLRNGQDHDGACEDERHDDVGCAGGLRTAKDAALFATGVMLFVGIWLAPAPLALMFVIDTIVGLMLARSMVRVFTMRTGKGFAPPLLGAIVVLLVIGLFIIQGRRVAAEVYATRGLRALPTLDTSVAYLTNAARMNPWSDMYLRVLTEAQRLVVQKIITSPSAKDQQAQLNDLRNAADSALAFAKEAVRLAPGTAANWSALGNVYLDIAPITSGAAKSAEDAFGHAQTLSPSDPSLLLSLGMAKSVEAQAAQGDDAKTLQDQSRELLLRATALRPSYSSAHLELARLYGRLGNVDEALAAYRKAEVILPQDPALRYEVGLFLFGNDKKEEAVREMEFAIQLAPNFSNARWYLAQIYDEQKEYAKALEQIQKVVESNPENQQAKDRLEELQKKVK